MLSNAKAFSSFSVPDMDAAKKFYVDTLGIDVKETNMGLELNLAGGGIPVFIYHSTDYHAPEHTVLNFIVENIDNAIDELSSRGVQMEQYDLPGMKTDEKGVVRGDGSQGPKAIAWFKDPADHILALIQEK
ncbi:MAG TPA: VOC family protein [Candidatus Paceibacterota bacterium]|nr:VOC family protein [Candidatus Paceibacterota bacterium]